MSIRETGALLIQPKEGHDAELSLLLERAMVTAGVEVHKMNLGPENVDELIDCLESGLTPLVVKGDCPMVSGFQEVKSVG